MTQSKTLTIKPWSKFLVNAEIVQAYTQEQAMKWYRMFYADPIIRCIWLEEA